MRQICQMLPPKTTTLLFFLCLCICFFYHCQFTEHCSSSGWPSGGWNSSQFPAAVAGAGKAYRDILCSGCWGLSSQPPSLWWGVSTHGCQWHFQHDSSANCTLWSFSTGQATNNLIHISALLVYADHLVNRQCPAAKPWALAFMWMLHYTIAMALLNGSSLPNRTMTHHINCSGMARGTWQKAKVWSMVAPKLIRL